MKRIRIVRKNSLNLTEKTHTMSDGSQYWSRKGKYYKWTESGGREEISKEDYMKALSPDDSKGDSSKPKDDKKEVPKEDMSKSDEEPIEDIDIDTSDDNDLVRAANSGNTDASEKLINKYEPLVHKVTNKYFIKGGDKEDLLQYGRIGVWNAIESYDPDKNVDFYPFAKLSIERSIQKAVRADNTNKSSVNNDATSLHSPAGTDGSDRELGDVLPDKRLSPEEEYLGEEGARNLRNFMENELSKKELNIINKFVDGYSIEEIADTLDSNYKSIQNALMRVRYKIREYKDTNESKKIRESVKRVRFKRS